MMPFPANALSYFLMMMPLVISPVAAALNVSGSKIADGLNVADQLQAVHPSTKPSLSPSLAPVLEPNASVIPMPECEPTQLHVSPGTPADSSMWVSWMTKSNCSSIVEVKEDDDSILTARSPPAFRYHVDEGNIPRSEYMYATAFESDFIHHVHIMELKADTTYAYRVGGECNDEKEASENDTVANNSVVSMFSPGYSFKTLRSPGKARYEEPMRFAVIGDIGDTKYSNATLFEASESANIDRSEIGAGVEPEFVVIVGDMSYADGDGSKWDAWGRHMEPILHSLPLLVLPGNHEIEIDRVSGEAFVHYRNRFRTPEIAPEQSVVGEVIDAELYKFNFTYDFGSSFYSFDAGLVHFVMLNVYTKSNEQSAQFKWLCADLAAVDREATPWILVFTHSPWYDSNLAHQAEEATLAMREAMEPLVHEHRVAVVFAGHVHAVERSHPAWADRRDEVAGTVYITIGDGGNAEGHADSWSDEVPEWSAFRNGKHYGRGDILVANETHLRWDWLPIGDVGEDMAWITNPYFHNSTFSHSSETDIAGEVEVTGMTAMTRSEIVAIFSVSTVVTVIVLCFVKLSVRRNKKHKEKKERLPWHGSPTQSPISKGRKSFARVAGSDQSDVKIGFEQVGTWSDLREDARRMGLFSESNASAETIYMAPSAKTVLSDPSSPDPKGKPRVHVGSADKWSELRSQSASRTATQEETEV
mmetsp:Transcript_6844/g.12707  ORF Transcript_6844/g.12707 Transcript_6844/m.12707 type:complete len:702 (+) Transcript_6844:63-2168(+)